MRFPPSSRLLSSRLWSQTFAQIWMLKPELQLGANSLIYNNNLWVDVKTEPERIRAQRWDVHTDTCWVCPGDTLEDKRHVIQPLITPSALPAWIYLCCYAICRPRPLTPDWMRSSVFLSGSCRLWACVCIPLIGRITLFESADVYARFNVQFLFPEIK